MTCSGNSFQIPLSHQRQKRRLGTGFVRLLNDTDGSGLKLPEAPRKLADADPAWKTEDSQLPATLAVA
jgi:hypothetical protein